MTNLEQEPTADATADAPADPLTVALSALSESWMRGAAAMEQVLTQAGGLSPGGPRPQADAGDKQTEVASLIAQSYMVAARSGLRYMSGVAQVFGSYQASIFSSLLNPAGNRQLSERERGAIAENIRGYLREVGDLAHREARLLQLELGRVGDAVAEATQESNAGAPHQRRWKAKP